MHNFTTHTTEEVGDLLLGNRETITSTTHLITFLERDLTAAWRDLARAKQTHEHLDALHRWRQRTGADAGDPITEMIALIMRVNEGQGWRIWRIDQNPFAPSLGSALLTLRDPAGEKLLLMFDSTTTITVTGDGRQSCPSHEHINRAIHAAWYERCEQWHFVLPPTRQRGEASVIAHGAIHAITPL
jgi:hypothetical protein